jgi:protein-tyrosine-phosphatase
MTTKVNILRLLLLCYNKKGDIVKDAYKILAVGQENKGRSAAYEAHMGQLLIPYNIFGGGITNNDNILCVEVESAGVNEERIKEFERTGELDAHPGVMGACILEKNAKILTHQTEMVSKEKIKKADVVLAFDRKTRDQLYDMFPRQKKKIQTIRQFVTTEKLSEEELDIDDVCNPIKDLYKGKILPETHEAFCELSKETKQLARETIESLYRKGIIKISLSLENGKLTNVTGPTLKKSFSRKVAEHAFASAFYGALPAAAGFFEAKGIPGTVALNYAVATLPIIGVAAFAYFVTDIFQKKLKETFKDPNAMSKLKENLEKKLVPENLEEKGLAKMMNNKLAPVKNMLYGSSKMATISAAAYYLGKLVGS